VKLRPRLPQWEDDREKRALRPPLDLRERARLGLKVPVPFLAYLWFQAQPISGAAALTAFAAAVGILSLVELAWLRSTSPRERIFTRTKEQAVRLHAGTVAAAVVALVYAVPRLP
jgi:hypothetical protein